MAKRESGPNVSNVPNGSKICLSSYRVGMESCVVPKRESATKLHPVWAKYGSPEPFVLPQNIVISKFQKCTLFCS